MITVDDREVTQHPDIIQRLKTPVTVQRLDSADFAFLNRNFEPVGIERCELGNLLQKIRSGQLEEQLIRCVQDYNHVILLIEGVYDTLSGQVVHYKKGDKSYYRNRIEPSFTTNELEALLVRLSELGIEVMWSPCFEYTMQKIDTIFAQRTKPEEEHTFFRKTRAIRIPVKNTANPSVPMLMALCPRLPEKTAIQLIYKYDTIWNVLNADPKELVQVEGFGKGLMKKLLQGVGKNVE